MSDCLLFLGAGASKVFGVPTMTEFVDSLGAEVERDRKPDAVLYSQIVEQLKRVYAGSLDLEAVLDTVADISSGFTTEAFAKRTAPRLAYRIARLKDARPQQIEQALKEIDSQLGGDAHAAGDLLKFSTDYIRRVCAKANVEVAAETYRSFFVQLSQIIRSGAAVDGAHAMLDQTPGPLLRTGQSIAAPYVATTNYDLCFEAFCSRYFVRYVNGFSHSRPEHEFDFDPEIFDQQEGIHLLKVHGSIDWWKTTSNRVVETQYASSGQKLRSGDAVSDLCIRYPVNDKQLFEYPFLELYSRLGRYLNRAKVWLFIGYRFGDPSIRNMVTDLARQDKKIIVVAPMADNILQNELRLADKVPAYAIRLKFPNVQCINQIETALRDRPDALHPQLRILS